MSRLTRRSLAAAALLCAGLGGCAAPGGLGRGEPAPPVSAQPQAKPLWPMWTGESPKAGGAAVSSQAPPPTPLDGAPTVGPEGIEKIDVRAVLKADRPMKSFADKKDIAAPGRPGLRPPRFNDLTGNGKPELIVAVDTETGRSILAVYTEVDGKILPILRTSGRRLSPETVGTDLLVRTTDDDGSAHVVRYHWDGVRMVVVSDEKRFGNPTADPGECPTQRPPASGTGKGSDLR
ncbi:hypothetical protein [Streptomyces sp. NPDC059411]|uniref:hypothetical protein n=1 Tax=Streptomyces sp. NPDC059411 TaxID=3346825 RepID=UPI0036B4EC6C